MPKATSPPEPPPASAEEQASQKRSARLERLLNTPLYEVLEAFAHLTGFESDREFTPGEGAILWRHGSILDTGKTFKTIFLRQPIPAPFRRIEVKLFFRPALEFPIGLSRTTKPITIFRLMRKGWTKPHLLWLRISLPQDNRAILMSDVGCLRGDKKQASATMRLEPGVLYQLAATIRLPEKKAGAWIYDAKTGELLSEVTIPTSTRFDTMRADYLRIQIGETGRSKYASPPEGWVFEDLTVELKL